MQTAEIIPFPRHRRAPSGFPPLTDAEFDAIFDAAFERGMMNAPTNAQLKPMWKGGRGQGESAGDVVDLFKGIRA